ncbi:DUF7260 family protein [Natrinema caseinilyticum]|uniref:DUF7260 family protein n=1 Tax=Natrinema caseinilyticum TaxID=2961570 RepID=UPI0020C295C1|nr:hypothetical protein [Natrinema caseinilyticum]
MRNQDRASRLLGLSLLVFVVGIGDTSVWFPFSVTQGLPELTTATLTASGYLTDAKSVTETERTRVATERDAFRRFARLVESISVSEDTHTGPLVFAGGGDSGTEHLCTVRNAYRETVMNVPHFEDEYDENLRESLTLEFDDHLATALLDGQQFSPLLKNTVLVQATAARESREKLLDGIDDELTSLENARKRLREHDRAVERAMKPRRQLRTRSVPTLREYDAILREDEDRCEQLLADRQHEIHRENRSYSRSSKPALQQYLYDALDVTYPVLATVTERIQDIRGQRRLIRETMTNQR